MQAETPDVDLQDAGAARGGPTLLQIAWQRKSLVILGLMIGMVLGLLYYAQRQPIYQATAQILVVPKTPGGVITNEKEGRTVYMEDYMATQSALIKSPVIIEKAVRALGGELKSFPGERPDELVYSIRD